MIVRLPKATSRNAEEKHGTQGRQSNRDGRSERAKPENTKAEVHSEIQTLVQQWKQQTCIQSTIHGGTSNSPTRGARKRT